MQLAVALNDDEPFRGYPGLQQRMRHRARTAAQFDHHTRLFGINFVGHGPRQRAGTRQSSPERQRRAYPRRQEMMRPVAVRRGIFSASLQHFLSGGQRLQL